MRYMADIPGNSPGGYFSGGCYIVLTQLGDSWILRAAHGDMEAAQAEAFRWRRIYGPERTRIAAVNQGASPSAQPEAMPAETISNLPVIIDVVPEPANDIAAASPPMPPPASRQPGRARAQRKAGRPIGRPLGWGETLLRALLLYFVYSLANRLIDLAILMQGA